MTDTELNERIAVLLGWKRHETIADVWIDPSRGGTASRRGLPDFFAPERLHEMVGLAKRVFHGGFAISYVPGFASGGDWEADNTYPYHDDDERCVVEYGKTPCIALARAIVAASEKSA